MKEMVVCVVTGTRTAECNSDVTEWLNANDPAVVITGCAEGADKVLCAAFPIRTSRGTYDCVEDLECESFKVDVKKPARRVQSKERGK